MFVSFSALVMVMSLQEIRIACNHVPFEFLDC